MEDHWIYVDELIQNHIIQFFKSLSSSGQDNSWYVTESSFPSIKEEDLAFIGFEISMEETESFV